MLYVRSQRPLPHLLPETDEQKALNAERIERLNEEEVIEEALAAFNVQERERREGMG